MFWNYFHNRFAKLVQKGTVDEVFQLMDSEYEFPEKAQEALILRKNEAEIRGYFIRKRTLSDANQVLLIEQMPSEIFDLVDHQSVCDKAVELIVQNGNSDYIKLLLHNQQVPENVQNAVMKRDIEAEIRHLLVFQRDISIGVIRTVAERGRLDEVEILLDKHRVFEKLDLQSKTATTLLQLRNQIEIKRNAEIVSKGDSQEIISMLKTLKGTHKPALDEESRDKIILRGNPEEITAYLDSGFLPGEKAIVYLIDNGFYEFAARCLNTDCYGYSPITEKVLMSILEKGDEFLVFALLRRNLLVAYVLKQMNKQQEWFENQILARGSKDEIACMARIYKVSDYTVDEILRRNIGQEIKALIDGKNISDAHIYKLIDLQCYDLLENYARCVPNNPTFYLLTKYMKAHH